MYQVEKIEIGWKITVRVERVSDLPSSVTNIEAVLKEFALEKHAAFIAGSAAIHSLSGQPQRGETWQDFRRYCKARFAGDCDHERNCLCHCTCDINRPDLCPRRS